PEGGDAGGGLEGAARDAGRGTLGARGGGPAERRRNGRDDKEAPAAQGGGHATTPGGEPGSRFCGGSHGASRAHRTPAITRWNRAGWCTRLLARSPGPL